MACRVISKINSYRQIPLHFSPFFSGTVQASIFQLIFTLDQAELLTWASNRQVGLHQVC